MISSRLLIRLTWNTGCGIHIHSESSYSTRYLINKSHLEPYPQETAAAGKGTFDIKEMWNFTEFEEARSNISHSNTTSARAGPCFQQIYSFYSSSGLLTALWVFTKKHGILRAKMKSNVIDLDTETFTISRVRSLWFSAKLGPGQLYRPHCPIWYISTNYV